ncbi:MAG: hypothetical protein AAGK38_12875, partial [Pseudomonadota bacterium]
MAKILVPFFPYEDTFVGNVIATLRAMGHAVLHRDSKPWSERHRFAGMAQASLEKLDPNRPNPAEKWALQVTRSHGPFDLVLCTTRSFGDTVLFQIDQNLLAKGT